MDGYARAHFRYGESIARTIGNQFVTAGGIDDAAAAVFAQRAAATASAGRYAVARLTAQYLARQVEMITGGEQLLYGSLQAPHGVEIPPDAFTTQALRSGLSDGDLWLRPMISTRTALARGERFVDAMAAGRAVAAATAHTDVALAQRSAVRYALEHDERVVGTRRVPGWRSCGLCNRAAERVYRVLELMPIHTSCRCTVSAIVSGRDPAARRNDVTTRAAREPPVAAVEIDLTTEIAPSLVEVPA